MAAPNDRSAGKPMVTRKRMFPGSMHGASLAPFTTRMTWPSEEASVSAVVQLRFGGVRGPRVGIRVHHVIGTPIQGRLILPRPPTAHLPHTTIGINQLPRHTRITTGPAGHSQVAARSSNSVALLRRCLSGRRGAPQRAASASNGGSCVGGQAVCPGLPGASLHKLELHRRRGGRRRKWLGAGGPLRKV